MGRKMRRKPRGDWKPTRHDKDKARNHIKNITKGVLRHAQQGNICLNAVPGVIAGALQRHHFKMGSKVTVEVDKDLPNTLRARFVASRNFVTLHMNVPRTHSVPMTINN